MKRLIITFLISLSTIQVLAQEQNIAPALSQLQIETVRITRSPDNQLLATIQATATSCGEVFIMDWSTAVGIDFLLVSSTDSLPAGEVERAASLQQYINLWLFTLPTEDLTCDLDLLQTVQIELPAVPEYWYESRWETILLINEFAGWFYLADETPSSSTNRQSQPLYTGETSLVPWQKVDSVVEQLYSVGANPGTFIPWFQVYHGDDCEAPAHVNLILNNHSEPAVFEVDIFRLLPLDAECDEAIIPFVAGASGAIPQRDFILTFGDKTLHYSSETITTTAIDRRYLTIHQIVVQPDSEGYEMQIISSLSETCDSPVELSQAVVDDITFLSLYYDVFENTICTEESTIYEVTIEVDELPVIVNDRVFTG